MKRCTKCGKEKPLSEFNKDRHTKDGLQFRCKECDNATSKRWAHTNPEQVRERGRQWRKENIEKARERDRIRWASRQAITEEVKLALFEFYNHTCLCCGEGEIKLELDHIVPLKLGGEDVIENLQPLCHSCNASKGAKTMDYRQEVLY